MARERIIVGESEARLWLRGTVTLSGGAALGFAGFASSVDATAIVAVPVMLVGIGLHQVALRRSWKHRWSNNGRVRPLQHLQKYIEGKLVKHGGGPFQCDSQALEEVGSTGGKWLVALVTADATALTAGGWLMFHVGAPLFGWMLLTVAVLLVAGRGRWLYRRLG